MKSVTLFILAVIDTEHTVIRSYTCYHHEDAPAPDASEANNMTSIMKQMDRTKAAVREGIMYRGLNLIWVRWAVNPWRMSCFHQQSGPGIHQTHKPPLQHKSQGV